MNKKPFAKRASRFDPFLPSPRTTLNFIAETKSLMLMWITAVKISTVLRLQLCRRNWGGWDPEYTVCRQQCEVMYMSCSTCDSFGEPPDCEDVDIPDPYPVWADWTHSVWTVAKHAILFR